MVRLFRFKIW